MTVGYEVDTLNFNVSAISALLPTYPGDEVLWAERVRYTVEEMDGILLEGPPRQRFISVTTQPYVAEIWEYPALRREWR
jgi:hypothetical protein